MNFFFVKVLAFGNYLLYNNFITAVKGVKMRITNELKKKIGRLFMLGIPGEQISEEYRDFCETYYCGNFCISAANASTTEGLCAMTDELRKMAYRLVGEYPFISIDQEGGRVTRFYEGAAMIANAMNYSAIGADRTKMTEVGFRLGKILRALGCNIDNAPVLDVNIDPMNPIIGTRAYSDDPEKVAELGVGFSRGLEKAGVITAVKHFPGHGNVSADTHLATAVNRVDGETLRKTEFLPFRRAFEAGAGATMTAHVSFSEFGEKPATLSREIVTDLLRGEMGFDGVVITDSLIMRAIANAYPKGEAAVLAILAGCDQLLYYPFKKDFVEEAVNALYEAVESGRISEARIDESCERIARQKQKYAIDTCAPDLALAKALIGDEKAIEANFADMLSSVTCLWDDGILSELKGKRILCVAPTCEAFLGVEESRRQTLSFAELFAAEFANCTPCVSSVDGLTPEVSAAIEGDFDVAVVGLFGADLRPRQLEIVKAIRERGRPVVAVLLKSPYEARYIKDCNAAIACYGYVTISAKATIRAIKNNDYRGVLPVSLDS